MFRGLGVSGFRCVVFLLVGVWGFGGFRLSTLRSSG